MQTIALYQIKGGVGKTAAAVNLAYLAAQSGRRVLLWDLDAQGAASFYFRIESRIKGGGKALLEKRNRMARATKGSDFPRLDVMPADFSLRFFDAELASKQKPKSRIRMLLESIESDYDLCFVDCAPSASVLAESILRAADIVLLPVVPTTLSLRTYGQARVKLLTDKKVDAKAYGFLSMVDRRKAMQRDIAKELSHRSDILASIIPYAAEIERMGETRAPVGEFAPSSRGALAFLELWKEVSNILSQRRM